MSAAAFTAHWQKVCEDWGRSDLLPAVAEGCQFLWGELERTGMFNMADVAAGKGYVTFVPADGSSTVSYLGYELDKTAALYSREGDEPWKSKF